MTDINFAKALAEFQKELPAVTLDGDNPHFKSKYATLANVTNIVLPKLVEHGFAFTTGSRVEGGLLILEAKLIHESGEYESASFPIADTNPQKVGSAVTYYRRYALASLTGIVADADDDGNGASIPTVGDKRIEQAREVGKPKPAAKPTSPAGNDLNGLKARIREYIGSDDARKRDVNTRLEALKAEGASGIELHKTLIEELGIS